MLISPRIAARWLVFLTFVAGTACVSVEAQALPNLVPQPQSSARVTVLPVIFVPRDVAAPDLVVTSSLLAQHLELAQTHYWELLGTTFEIEPGEIEPGLPLVHYSKQDDAHFTDVVADTADDRAHRIVSELFRHLRSNRYTTDHILLVIYASARGPIAGGGRTFNGPPGTGGGYVEMDLASLLADQGYPFQSTLVHELGHAFGMTHVDCHGYDQQTNGSIMSYNPAHHSSGLTRSATPGGFVPEDYVVLALNQRVFPGLTFDATRHGIAIDSANLQSCFLGPMATTVGPLRDLPGAGFELYFDGQQVNGPDAALYSRAHAEETCRWNNDQYPTIWVECRYNGQLMQ